MASASPPRPPPLTSHLPLLDSPPTTTTTTMTTPSTTDPDRDPLSDDDGLSLSLSLLPIPTPTPTPTPTQRQGQLQGQRPRQDVEEFRPSLFQLFGGKPTLTSTTLPLSVPLPVKDEKEGNVPVPVSVSVVPVIEEGLVLEGYIDTEFDSDPSDPSDPSVDSVESSESAQSMINMVLEDIELLREANYLLKNDQMDTQVGIKKSRHRQSHRKQQSPSGGASGVGEEGERGSKKKKTQGQGTHDEHEHEGWKDENEPISSLDEEVEELLTRRLAIGIGMGMGMEMEMEMGEGEGFEQEEDEEEEEEEETTLEMTEDDDVSRASHSHYHPKQQQQQDVGIEEEEKEGEESRVIVEEAESESESDCDVDVDTDPDADPSESIPIPKLKDVSLCLQDRLLEQPQQQQQQRDEEGRTDTDIAGMTLLALLGDDDEEEEIDDDDQEEEDGLGLGLGLVFLDSPTESESKTSQTGTLTRTLTDDPKNVVFPPIGDGGHDRGDLGPFATVFGQSDEDDSVVRGLLLGEQMEMEDPPFTTLDDLIHDRGGPLLMDHQGLELHHPRGGIEPEEAGGLPFSALGDISDLIDEDTQTTSFGTGFGSDSLGSEEEEERFTTLEDLIFEPEEDEQSIAPRQRQRRLRTRSRGQVGNGQIERGLTNILKDEGQKIGKRMDGPFPLSGLQMQTFGTQGEPVGGVDSDEIDLYLDPIPFIPPGRDIDVASQPIQQNAQPKLQPRFRTTELSVDSVSAVPGSGSRSDLSSGSSPHSVGSWFRPAGRYESESESESRREHERRRMVRERRRLRDRRDRAWGYRGYSDDRDGRGVADEEDFDLPLGHEEVENPNRVVTRKLTFDDVPEEEEEEEGMQMSPIESDVRTQAGGGGQGQPEFGVGRREPVRAGPAPVRITPEDIGDVVNPETQASSIGLPDALSHYSSVVGAGEDGDALAFLGSNRGRVGLRKAPTNHVHDESRIFYAGEQGLLFLPFEEGICCYCSQVVGVDPACMDKHYVEACPLLMVCEVCSWLVGIPHYEHHLAFECAGKDALLMCPKCMKVFQWMDYGEHERVCDGDERSPIREANRCWMCSDDIPSGIQGWRKHLLEIGCPLTWRKSSIEVRRKRRESFGDDSDEQRLKTPPPTSLGHVIDEDGLSGDEPDDRESELGPPELEVTTERAFVGISELRHLRDKIDSLFHTSIAGATPARKLQNQFLDAVPRSPSSREIPDSDLEERELFPSDVVDDDDEEEEEEGDDDDPISRRTSRSVPGDDFNFAPSFPRWPRRTRSRFESGPSDLDAPSPSSASVSAGSTPPRPRRRRRRRHSRRRVESEGSVGVGVGDLPSLRRCLSEKFEEMELAVHNFSNIQPEKRTETGPGSVTAPGVAVVDDDPSSLLSDQELLNGLSLERIRQMEEHEKELLTYVEKRKRQVEASRVRSILREADISRQEFLERVSSTTTGNSKSDASHEMTWPSFSLSDARPPAPSVSLLRPRSHSESDSYEFVRLQPRVPAEFRRYSSSAGGGGGGQDSDDVLSLSSILPEDGRPNPSPATVSRSLLAFQDFRKRLDDISKSVDHW